MIENRPSSEVFYWDAPRRELHKRDLFPLQIEIAGKRYTIPKWTIDHFKLVDFPVPLPTNKVFKIKPIIRFRDFNIQFETSAIPLHYDPKKRELIARFKNIPEEHRELLQYFSEALETGDMVNIDNVLRRVDMPVTPASTQLKTPSVTQSPKLKRSLFTSAYLLLGSALLLFTLSTFYNKFTHINVESAFVSAPVFPVQSPYPGSIKEMLITKGNIISRGQPLLKLDTSDSVGLPMSYKMDAAKQQVTLFNALIKEKQEKLKNKAVIRKKKLNAAKASLSASVTTRNIKCKHRYASLSDRRNPQKRKAECSAAKRKVAALVNSVASEKESLTAINKQVNSSNASIQVLQAKLKRAEFKLKTLKDKPHLNFGKETLVSSVSGKVIEVIQDKQQHLNKGQTVALIQKQNTQQFIDAYVTQKQATQLNIGDNGFAISPTLENEVPVIIDKIDFINNNLSTPNKNLFNWNVPSTHTAKITLKFSSSNVSRSSKEKLPFGLPVTLNIEKNSASNTVETNESSDQANQNSASDASTDYGHILFGTAFADNNNVAQSIPTYCKNKQRLFPQSFINNLKGNTEDSTLSGVLWKKTLLKKANALLNKKPNALKTLHSSGITDANNKDLKQTRIALRDGNNTAILALAFYLSQQEKDSDKGTENQTITNNYLQKAKQNLLAWAKTYQPNGHPIDETRLEGFLWSYDLLTCYFSWEEQKQINAWLIKLQENKQQWKFGPSSSNNNLRTHQLKILLMIDRLLEDKAALKADQALLKEHAKNNLFKNGESFDYQERDSLHYHVYNLEPWLEIALLEPEYTANVNQAYDFLIKQIKSGNIHDQFVNSKQAIDKKRAKGGFKYAKKGGSYKTDKITRSVIAHKTLNQLPLNKDATVAYLSKQKVKQNIFYFARHYFWKE